MRAEYAAVPTPVYRQKRREVLGRFLARPPIYATPALRERPERQARWNVGKVI
jgi:predicted metal-dependent HD superfamily phosphohydrolase